MNLALIATSLLASITFAYAAPDEKPASTPPPETVKFVELKYLGNDNSDRLNRVISVVQQITRGSAQIVSDPVLHTIAITGTPEGVTNAEQLLRRFDTPAAEAKQHQIQLVMYLVEASDQASSDQRIPSDLTSPIEQLRKAFGYKGFRVIDTVITQSRENAEFSISGLIPGSANALGHQAMYEAQYKGVSYSESQKALTVTGFRFYLRVPVTIGTNTNFTDSAIRTAMTIKDGQKLVLGKLTKDQSERGVFLIVSSKID
jgi:type II secretory pathway component GspD/PulD (secretin)